MAAARYWRLIGLETYSGGDLELGAIELHDASTRLDGAATITCSHAPISGSLSNLSDADDSTRCRFRAADVSSAGFWLQWDFGASVEPTHIRLIAGSAREMCLATVTVCKQVSSAWVAVVTVGRFPWDRTTPIALSSGQETVESFAVDVAGRYVHTTGQSTVTWPSETESILVSGAGSGGWAFDVLTYAGAMAPDAASYIEADVEFASDSFGRRHVGLFIGSTSGAGYRIGGLDGTFLIDRFGTGDGSGVNILTVGSNPFATVGVTGTMRIERTAAGVFTVYWNGQLLGSSSADTTFTDLKPGVFTYWSDLRVYETRAGILGSNAYLPLVVHTRGARATLAASSHVPAHSSLSAHRLQLARDIEHGGHGTVYGTTKTKGTPNQPAKARVVLQHQRSKLPVRETWSDPVTGNFAFTGIDTTQQCLTLAEDAAGNFRPVAANRLTPEVLP